MWLEILLVLVGIALIVFGANILTDGASAIAERFRIPQIIIGLTIVAFGTSAPELSVSVISSMEGNGGIAVGNVIGSNIFNILAILGVTALIYPVPVERNTLRFDIPIAVLAAVMLLLMLSDPALDGTASSITRVEALILVIMGLLFLAYTFVMGKKGAADAVEVDEPEKKLQHWAVSIAFIIGGLAGLVYGGRLFVDNAAAIAGRLGVSDTLIGLTLVSWGTSMPELATSAIAAMKKNTGIAVGNVVGSNLFNIFFVLGIAGTINPLKSLQFTAVDLWMQLLAVIIALATVMFWGNREIKRGEGAIMLLVFVAYNAFLISTAV
ncbi:MAG: calcium/sodium antiporter [Porphyromonas sp.]|nr:calcium/sodium antiporter [Porphyromonas sp.]